MKKLFLVTGGAGHLGSAVINRLHNTNADIRTLCVNGERNPPNDVEVCYGDVSKPDTLLEFFSGCSQRDATLIHCAGIVSIASKFSQQMQNVNVQGTRNVVDLAQQYGVSKLVYVSSVHAIPESADDSIISETDVFSPDAVIGQYAKTKAEATAYVLNAAKNGLDASVVFPSGIIGPYDNGHGHMTVLVTDYIMRRLTAAIKGGYDFVDVRDVANGIVSCAENGERGEGYILSNRYFTIGEILYYLHEITGQKEIKSFLPIWFVKLMAPLCELYYKILNEPPLFTKYSLLTISGGGHFTHDKATKQLGYTARDMKETLIDTVSWLKDSGRIPKALRKLPTA